MSQLSPSAKVGTRRRGLLFNLIWTGSSAATSQGALFVSNIIFARILGEAALADYLVVLTIATMAPALFSLGMERLGVVILINSHRGHLSSKFRAILIVAFFSSLAGGLASGVAVAIGPFLSIVHPSVAILVGVLVAIENARIMLADLPRAWGRADFSTMAGPALPRLLVLVVICIAHFQFQVHFTIEALLLVLICSTVTSLLLGAYFIRRLMRNHVNRTASPPERSRPLSALVKAGVPLSIANVALVVLSYADTLIVATHFNALTLASFALISRTSNLLGNAKTMLNVAVMPILSVKPENSKDAHEQLLMARSVMTVLFVLVAPLALLCGFWASNFFGWLFGEEYSAASAASIWLMLGQLVSIAMGLAGTILLRDGRQVTIMWIQVSAAALTLVSMLVAAGTGDIGLVGLASGSGTALCALMMALVLWRASQAPSWILGPVTFVHTIKIYLRRRKTS